MMTCEFSNSRTTKRSMMDARAGARGRVALLGVAFLCSLSLGACDSPKADGDCAPDECEANTLALCEGGPGDDPVTILSAAIEGDLLMLEVSYGGGCEEHVFGGCWDGGFDLSQPPGASFSLWHDANKDGCEAALEEMIELSLAPMKLAYQDGDPELSGTILVNVEGFDETVEYSF